ncbi:MAG: YmaF family protein [Lachnospiraceae bacterium]|nr:YmaF family protein [Lachnospiraceae bacterium]
MGDNISDKKKEYSNQHHECDKQKHVHEITGSTRVFRECDECHNHRFCTVTGEAIYTPDKKQHYHEVKFRTDFSDRHFHEFCGKTGSKRNQKIALT